MQSYMALRRMLRLFFILPCCLGWLLCIGFSTASEAAVEGRPCTAEPTDMTVAYGDLLTCSIDVSGDTDVFRFSANAGAHVVLLVTSRGSLRPCLELVAPDNTRMVACENAFSQRIDTTLPLKGRYTILVSAASFSGEYVLAVERVAPPSFGAQ